MNADVAVSPVPPSQSVREQAPTLPLMHAAFVLTGLGTMLLGPILPLLAVHWHLKDSQSGLLLLAQFCGATLGGSTVSARLQRGLQVGLFAAALGFLAFALSPGLPYACAGLLVGGFGVGRTITAINITAGARYTFHRASALARLNFTWSFGALLSPLLAAWLTPRLPLSTLLAAFATLFLAVAAVFAWQLRSRPLPPLASEQTPAAPSTFNTSLFLYFAAFLFVYGGFETSLSAWLTTYALRYGQSSLVLSEYTMVLFLCGLTSGRALSAWLLLKMQDTTLQRLGLALSAILTAALAASHRSGLIALLAVLLGVCLAPVFPATFALLMAHRPPARRAGLVLAGSGVGAAALPWLMGVVSTRNGSLQLALLLPIAAALLMLLLAIRTPSSRL